MSEFFVWKLKNVLYPCPDSDMDQIRKLPKHQPLRVKITRIRNVEFHRKYFALMNMAFDYWEPPSDYAGEKNFQRFRDDVTILCGFYDQYVRLNGDVRLEAKSISFANMDQDEFEELYSKTIDVIIKYVLTNYTGEELQRVLRQIEEFE